MCSSVVSFVLSFPLLYLYLSLLKLLDEVRPVGSHRKGTAISGNKVADVVVLFKVLPSGVYVYMYLYHVFTYSVHVLCASNSL